MPTAMSPKNKRKFINNCDHNHRTRLFFCALGKTSAKNVRNGCMDFFFSFSAFDKIRTYAIQPEIPALKNKIKFYEIY